MTTFCVAFFESYLSTVSTKKPQISRVSASLTQS
jgi:hypothetical protein